MTIELKEPSLVAQIKRLAADQAQPAEKVLEAAVQAHLDQLEREAIHAETEAFWDMHDEAGSPLLPSVAQRSPYVSVRSGSLACILSRLLL